MENIRKGQLPLPEDLVDIKALLCAYNEPAKRPVSFGTSGHRGSSFEGSFQEEHILAITQAICDVRKKHGIKGPLFLGMDSHALSKPAYETVLNVLNANKIQVLTERNLVPTPALSHAILSYNLGRTGKEFANTKDLANSKNSLDTEGLADGIILTPSHNPPQDGGIKYNSPNGGPADLDITTEIAEIANRIMGTHIAQDTSRTYVKEYDFLNLYINDLPNVVDMKAITGANLHIAVNPMSGASADYWKQIANTYALDITITTKSDDPTFSAIPLDHDGKIRMDCSSVYAMAGLIAQKDAFDIGLACDADADRHGIVGPDGLISANHFLVTAAAYLFDTRKKWSKNLHIGKTIVTTSMLDKLAIPTYETPVGFKWFVEGIQNKKLAFACEESAGASFLCFDCSPWSTDKDGILLCLLALEIMATKKMHPSKLYKKLEEKHGIHYFKRIDSPMNGDLKQTFNTLKNLSSTALSAHNTSPNADPDIISIESTARGNNAPIDGIKICTKDGYFVARPSGTEPIYKVYLESTRSEEHLEELMQKGQHFLDSLK